MQIAEPRSVMSITTINVFDSVRVIGLSRRYIEIPRNISETNYSYMTKYEIPASFIFAYLYRFVTLECYDEQSISTPWCSSDRETAITDRGLVPSASNGQQYWIDSGVTGFETSDKTMRAISRESKYDGCSRS